MDSAGKPKLSRRSMLAGAAAAGVVVPAVAASSVALVSAASGTTAARAATLRQITIYAEPLPGTNLFGYALEPGKPTIPGPLLEIYEGDTLEIELVNNTTQRLSIHPHGVNYDTASDGVAAQRLVQQPRRDPRLHLEVPAPSTSGTASTCRAARATGTTTTTRSAPTTAPAASRRACTAA